MALTIFAGGYSPNISSYVFDPAEPSLKLQGEFPAGANAAWIALDPSKQNLYAVNEILEGTFAQLSISKDQGKYVLGEPKFFSSGGVRPAYIEVLTDGSLAIANTNGICSIISAPGTEQMQSQQVNFAVQWSRPRQIFQNGENLIVPDSDADIVWKLGQDNGTWKVVDSFNQTRGSQPRRALITNNTLFTLHEDNTVLSGQLISPKLPVSTAIPIMPADPQTPQGAQFWAGEFVLPPTSNAYMYASVLSIGVAHPRGDSIAIIQYLQQPEAALGGLPTLNVTDRVFTGMNLLSGMAFSGDGKYLIVGSRGGGMKVYQRMGDGSELSEVLYSEGFPGIASFVWLPV